MSAPTVCKIFGFLNIFKMCHIEKFMCTSVEPSCTLSSRHSFICYNSVFS